MKVNYLIRSVQNFNKKENINWSKLTTPYNLYSTDAKFLETIKDCFFFQHVEKPARKRGRDRPSLLDPIFTNEESQVSDSQHHAPLGKSVLCFNFNC